MDYSDVDVLLAVSCSLHPQGLTGAAVKPLCVRSLSLSANQNASETPPARADSTFKVTMVPGDGVGPELMMAVKEVFKVNMSV